MGTLAGKVALVTGGSIGIGLASAQELIREGAFVYITGRKKAELDAAANRLGERCVSIQADISKMEDVDRIYKQIAGDRKAKRRSCVQAVIRRRWRTQNLPETHVSVLPQPCVAAGRASIDEL